jgi:hypothetical protein
MGKYGGKNFVDMHIRGESVESWICSCSYEAQDAKVCSHVVAAAMQYFSPVTADFSSRDFGKTTQNLRDAIDLYSSRNSKSPLSGIKKKIYLAPYLRLVGDKLFLELKIGTSEGASFPPRMYIVKNLRELVSAMEKGEYIKYGKDFEVCHLPECLEPKSLELYGFVCRKIYSEDEIMGKAHTIKDMRATAMTLRDLDWLFYIMGDTRIGILGHDTQSVVLRRGNPLLSVVIEGREPNGAVVAVDKCRLIGERDCCYIIKSDVLYRCDRAFSKDMFAFLKAMCRSAERETTISKNDLVTFCAELLPVISKWVFLKEKDISLEKYEPNQEAFSFYIDLEEKDYITCTAFVSYEEEKFNLLTGERVSEAVGVVRRNHGAERRAVALLLEYFDLSGANEDGVLSIQSDEDMLYRFMNSGIDELVRIGEVFATEAVGRLKIYKAPSISVGVRAESNLLKLTLKCDEIPVAELNALLKSYKQKKHYHRLQSGEFVELSGEGIVTVSELVDGLKLTGTQINESGNEISLPKSRAMYINSVLKGAEEIKLFRNNRFRELIKDMNNSADAEFEIPKQLDKVLRFYQKTGYRWLRTMQQYGFGGILADEMGLGKTVQVITLLLSNKQEGHISEPSLIVCPASLVYNWASEIDRFAKELNYAVVADDAAARRKIIENAGEYDLLITSYDLLRRDIEMYKGVEFGCHIIDEAQYIKNHVTQSARSVKEISSKYRFALTGTPIENRLSELWSIFDFLMPGFLFNYTFFRSEVEVPIVKGGNQNVRRRLHKMIAPFILRRMKNEVLRGLPDKLDYIVKSRMTGQQRRLYDAHVQKTLQNLRSEDGDEVQNKIAVLSEITRLRQLCCDPSLLFEDYTGGSAKLETCMELISNAISGGHKVLLFSQFTSMLKIIEERLIKASVKYCTVIGATGKEKRMSLVNAFNHDDTSVFLISLKAGGTGLNLTGADIVIHYDPWWNFAAQNQATDRAHRIGQSNVVAVYKLICDYSIEERIAELQESKRKLSDSIIAEGGSVMAAMSRQDLIALLEQRTDNPRISPFYGEEQQQEEQTQQE